MADVWLSEVGPVQLDDDGRLHLFVTLEGETDEPWCEVFGQDEPLPVEGVEVLASAGTIELWFRPDLSDTDVEQILEWVTRAVDSANRARAFMDVNRQQVNKAVRKWWLQKFGG